jgi:hypothetical protein
VADSRCNHSSMTCSTCGSSSCNHASNTTWHQRQAPPQLCVGVSCVIVACQHKHVCRVWLLRGSTTRLVLRCTPGLIETQCKSVKAAHLPCTAPDNEGCPHLMLLLLLLLQRQLRRLSCVRCFI